ncbi:MAG TPA: hypothetical protein VML55_05190, partial [Planctomycetaceae bacterium]|nr:hypothetical protein [Planctomycetaceae bacterium]
LVEPRGLIVYQFGDAPPPEREIMVTDYRGRALNVVRAEISTPLASARVTARDADADGHPRTRIAVQVAGDLPRGVHRGLVTIHTSDAAFPRLHVPLLIERR